LHSVACFRSLNSFEGPSPAVLPARVFLGENWARTGSRKALFRPSSQRRNIETHFDRNIRSSFTARTPGRLTVPKSIGERSPINSQTESAVGILPISRRGLNPFAQQLRGVVVSFLQCRLKKGTGFYGLVNGDQWEQSLTLTQFLACLPAAKHGFPFRLKYPELIHGRNAGSFTLPPTTGERSPDNSRTESSVAILPISRAARHTANLSAEFGCQGIACRYC